MPHTPTHPQSRDDANHPLSAPLPSRTHATTRGQQVPTQEFFARDMGLPLEMKPNYEDFSCQFRRAGETSGWRHQMLCLRC